MSFFCTYQSNGDFICNSYKKKESFVDSTIDPSDNKLKKDPKAVVNVQTDAMKLQANELYFLRGECKKQEQNVIVQKPFTIPIIGDNKTYTYKTFYSKRTVSGDDYTECRAILNKGKTLADLRVSDVDTFFPDDFATGMSHSGRHLKSLRVDTKL